MNNDLNDLALDLILGLGVYAISVAMLYFVFLIFYWVVLYLGTFLQGQRNGIAPRVERTFLFLAILWAVGLALNIVWTLAIHGRVYRSVDYGGLDCLPFLPLTRTTIDDFGAHGDLYGITMWQLQCVWAVFAACTWIFTIAIYKSLRRRFQYDANFIGISPTAKTS